MSLTAYHRARNIVETPRQTERRLMIEITGEMVQARDAGHTKGALMPTLHRNREVWRTFGIVCGSVGNALPNGLRASIVSLALWRPSPSQKLRLPTPTCTRTISFSVITASITTTFPTSLGCEESALISP